MQNITQWKRLLAYCLLSIILYGCGVSKNSYSPAKKYSLQQVQKDYFLYQNILEEHHPSLYWYTSRDSMDYYFNWGQQHLKDSMTEPEFRKVLNYVTSKIDCGHTSVRSSKSFSRYSDTARIGKLFPLNMKVWADNGSGEEFMAVTGNLLRRDTTFRRGTLIKKINGRTTHEILDTLMGYISTDGYNRTHKYQTLSNRGFFGSLYTSLFGISDSYAIEYMDGAGQVKNVVIPVFNPASDTSNRNVIRPIAGIPQPSKRERKRQQVSSVRLLKVDSANHSAMMDLASFGRGYGLKKFFRKSFKALKEYKIGHLIIDVRNNGGGSVTNSTNISRYIATNKFKISDSLFANRKRSRYSHYIQDHFWNKIFMTFLTKKRRDGKYHFGYFERHYFKSKKRDHYDGKVYILTGGNSFSATTLFVSAVIKQDNVTVVGEETGGGAYGNSAWLIPDVKLPETGVRFRLPLFRLVIDKDNPKNGRGVQPEVLSAPTVEGIRRNLDFKLEKAMELIRSDKDICFEGVVSWRGDPKSDGLGWVIAGNGTTYIPGNLADDYKIDGLRISVCLYPTDKEFPCECPKPLPVFDIRSIRKL